MDSLYTSPVNQDSWTVFLEQLVRISRSRSARLLVMDAAAERVITSTKINIDDRAHRDYVEYFVNACPWRPELKQKPAGYLYSTYLDFSCRQKRFYRTEFFNDWARNLDIHHGICGTVYRNNDNTIQLLVQRTQGQGPYDQADTAWFNYLVPHVRRTIELTRQMNELQWQREAGIQAAHRPFAIIGPQGRIEHLCERAEAMLRQEADPVYHQSRLRFRSARKQQRFLQLIAAVLASAGRGWQHAGGALSIPRHHREPMVCIISPLVLDPGSRTPLASGRALLSFHLPECEGRVDETLVAQLFNLTPAEARIAHGIAEGGDVRSLAKAQGTSMETVRGQLKSVFRKTGTRRQSELAVLILKSPALRAARTPPIRL